MVLNRGAFLAAASLSLAACIDEVTAGDSTIRGTYVLRTINGAALPFTKSMSGTTKVEILDDMITLFSGSTFAEEGHVRTTVNGQATTNATTETGVYGNQGISVALTGNSNRIPRITTITNANTMTIVEDGITYIYRK